MLAFVPILVNVHAALGLDAVVGVKLAFRLVTVFTANTSFEDEGSVIVAPSVVVFGFGVELLGPKLVLGTYMAEMKCVPVASPEIVIWHERARPEFPHDTADLAGSIGP